MGAGSARETAPTHNQRHTLHRASVIDLWNRVFDHPSTHRLPSRSIDLKLAHQDHLFFVARAGEKVVGTVMAGYCGHRAWLYSVSVDPAHRRQGHRRSAGTPRRRRTGATGCLKINLRVVHTNAKIVTFYESLGYSIEPHISMWKHLYERLD